MGKNDLPPIDEQLKTLAEESGLLLERQALEVVESSLNPDIEESKLSCVCGLPYQDPWTKKDREMDIVAELRTPEVDLHFAVECTQLAKHHLLFAPDTKNRLWGGPYLRGIHGQPEDFLFYNGFPWPDLRSERAPRLRAREEQGREAQRGWRPWNPPEGTSGDFLERSEIAKSATTRRRANADRRDRCLHFGAVVHGDVRRV